MKALLIIGMLAGIGYAGYQIGTIAGVYHSTVAFVKAEGGDQQAKETVDDLIDTTCKLAVSIAMIKAKFEIN